MVDRKNKKLSISRQCQLLSVSRSSYYYVRRPIKPEDLQLMLLIDEQYLKTPTWGSRSMCTYLCRLGHKVNRKRVQRLMRLMNLEAIYPKPKTSRPNRQHKVYPYLLKDMVIDRSNQVWASDITYGAPRLGISRGAYPWNTRNKLSCSSLWKGMSPSGGDLLLTGRVA